MFALTTVFIFAFLKFRIIKLVNFQKRKKEREGRKVGREGGKEREGKEGGRKRNGRKEWEGLNCKSLWHRPGHRSESFVAHTLSSMCWHVYR